MLVNRFMISLRSLDHPEASWSTNSSIHGTLHSLQFKLPGDRLGNIVGYLGHENSEELEGLDEDMEVAMDIPLQDTRSNLHSTSHRDQPTSVVSGTTCEEINTVKYVVEW